MKSGIIGGGLAGCASIPWVASFGTGLQRMEMSPLIVASMSIKKAKYVGSEDAEEAKEIEENRLLFSDDTCRYNTRKGNKPVI